MKRIKHLSVQIDPVARKKFHYVSRYEGRSSSSYIVYMINNCIREFEAVHGEIKIDDIEDEESKGKG